MAYTFKNEIEKPRNRDEALFHSDSIKDRSSQEQHAVMGGLRFVWINRHPCYAFPFDTSSRLDREPVKPTVFRTHLPIEGGGFLTLIESFDRRNEDGHYEGHKIEALIQVFENGRFVLHSAEIKQFCLELSNAMLASPTAPVDVLERAAATIRSIGADDKKLDLLIREAGVE